MKDNSCTLGIRQEDIEACGGPLPYLLSKGIDLLDYISMSIAQESRLEGEPTRKIRYHLRASKGYIKHLQGTLEGVELKPLMDEIVSNGYKLTLQPTRITFQDLNGHRITLKRTGKNKYRVSEIDGETILHSFTKEQLLDMSENSVCTMFCSVKAKSIQKKEFECTEITKDEL